MLLNQLCKSGQCLGKLYLPKTLAFQKIKIPLKARGHSYLSEEVFRFLLLHVVGEMDLNLTVQNGDGE